MTDSSTNTHDALISVIVPLYNQERYIKSCLRSIMRQTYRNLEIIVVNDGSTDNSLSIVRHLASLDNRIQFFNQANGGPAAARKRGYLNASGLWVVFVDSDDFLPADSVESLYSAAVSHHVDVVCGDFFRKWGPIKKYSFGFPRNMAGRPISVPELFSSYYLSFFGVNLYPVNACGKIYRKKVIDQAMTLSDIFMLPPLHMGEDEAFNLHLFPYIKSVFCLEKSIYVYRFGGITSGYNPYLPELLDFGDYRLGLLDQYQYEIGYQPLFIEYVNILLTHIQQGLAYGKWDPVHAKQWLQKELDNRYLVQRMQTFFAQKREIPNKCQMVLSRDLNRFLRISEVAVKHQRLRDLGKVLISRISR